MAKTYVRISGDPKGAKDNPDNDAYISPNRTPIDTNFDLRDRLAELVGRGNSLVGDDKAAIYGWLKGQLGDSKAQKILNHAYIFNARPEVQKLPLEDKLRAFYTIGSSDPDVMDVINRTKNLGYGVVPGARTSSSDINAQIYGSRPGADAVSTSPGGENIKKKIQLRISK